MKVLCKVPKSSTKFQSDLEGNSSEQKDIFPQLKSLLFSELQIRCCQNSLNLL